MTRRSLIPKRKKRVSERDIARERDRETEREREGGKDEIVPCLHLNLASVPTLGCERGGLP